MPRRTDRLAVRLLGGSVLLAALLLGWALSGAVEGGARARLDTLSRAGGLGWATVTVDGTRVRVSGTAPDAAAALAALNLVRRAGTHLALDDAIAVAEGTDSAMGATMAMYALDVLRDEQGVVLGGIAPSAEALGGLRAALAAQPGLGVPVDLARDLGAATPGPWAGKQEIAVVAARALLHGRITLRADGVTVAGLPRNAIGRAAIGRAAEALRGTGVPVTVDLVPPPQPGDTPPIFVADYSRGRVALVACAAPDTDSAAAAEALVAARGPGPRAPGRAVRCKAGASQTGLTAPAVWVEAVRAGLDALTAAPARRLEIEGVRVLLIPGQAGADAGFGAAEAALRAALPPTFQLAARSAAPTSPAVEEPHTGLWLRMRLTDGAVTVRGTAPDGATRSAVASYAAAQTGVASVEDAMAVAEAAAVQEGFRAAALAALDALSAVGRGEAIVRDQRVQMWGVTPTPAAARAAHGALEGVAAFGWTATTRITVDLPARVAALKLGPQACIDRLAATIAQEPILFAPSSATIEADSTAVLDRLAADLVQCAPLAVEVGGHTDSQGSEAYNNRLSEARAASVRRALIARGTGDVRLTATGYGPSQPIADNATEAGRALNRRIAFRALPPPPQTVTDPEAAADAPAAGTARDQTTPPTVPVPRP